MLSPNAAAFVRAFVVLVVLIAAFAGLLVYSIARRGLSTRAQPSRVEELVARSVRRAATPASMRTAANPVQPSAAVLAEGLEHFADHCAGCHANDGSGETDIGARLYPRAPDMRRAPTQTLSDGELFSIIENGIRLTGMPGWATGTPDGERASWVLVHFIRRLPTLTEDDITRMEALNPKTAEEWRAEEAARRFLAGEDVAPPAAPAHQH
jgi:mono/diheme cytochrome c family protein